MDCGYSVKLLLERRKVVVFGDGAGVDREIARLLVAGARVTWVAPRPSDTWRHEPAVTYIEDEPHIGCLAGAALILLCSDQTHLRTRVVQWGELLAIPVALAEPVAQTQPSAHPANGLGRVALVGAGPGDPELLTLKARNYLQQAEVVVFDQLISPDLLAMVPDSAAWIHVGKTRGQARMQQKAICALLVDLAQRGKRVVRLKGGDPMMFGRAAEEIGALRAAGIPVEVVPGVTAALGCAAQAGICLTDRRHAHGVLFISATRADEHTPPPWRGLLRPDHTLVVYMGLWRLEALCRDLMMEGAPPNLPVALICQGTSPHARVIRADLSTLPEAAGDAVSPALLIIGEVARDPAASEAKRLRPGRNRRFAALAAASAAMLPVGAG